MPDTEPQLPSVARAPISFVLLPGTGSGTDSPDVVAAWTAVLDGLDRDWELLLPERDGSRSLADGQPRIRVLRQTADAGAGGVLRAALAVARFPLLCHAPWDRQYQPADVKRLLDHIDPVHLASGIRKGQPMPTALRVAGWLYRGFVRVLFGVPLEPLPGWLGWGHRREHLLYRLLFGIRNPDATCPFRLIRKEIFARIPLQSDGPFVHVELLAKGRFLGGYYMDEVPVAWQPPATPESFAPKRPDLRRVWRAPEFRPAKPG